MAKATMVTSHVGSVETTQKILVALSGEELRRIVIALESMTDAFKKDAENSSLYEDKLFLYSEMGATFSLLFDLIENHTKGEREQVIEFLNM
jgi:hypothetical protein